MKEKRGRQVVKFFSNLAANKALVILLAIGVAVLIADIVLLFVMLAPTFNLARASLMTKAYRETLTILCVVFNAVLVISCVGYVLFRKN